MSGNNSLPDRITDHFIAEIVTGQLLPGTRLPPYRELAATLGVDQTSLRVALRILGRMHLITSVQGSGNVLNDYREVAGLDLLDSIYRIPELQLGRAQTLLALDNFLAILLYVLPTAFSKADAGGEQQFRAAMGQLRTAYEAGASARELAMMDLRGVDLLARQSGNLHLSMLLNSTHMLRLQLTITMYETIDVPAALASLSDIFEQAMRQQRDREQTRLAFHTHLATFTQGLREHIARLPEQARTTGPILDR